MTRSREFQYNARILRRQRKHTNHKMRFAYVAGALAIGATVSEARAVIASPSKKERAPTQRVEVVRFATPSRISKRTQLDQEDWNLTSDADLLNKDSINPALYQAGNTATGSLNPTVSAISASGNPHQSLAPTVQDAGSQADALLWTIEKKVPREPLALGDIQYTIKPVLSAKNRAKQPAVVHMAPISDTPDNFLSSEAPDSRQQPNPIILNQVDLNGSLAPSTSERPGPAPSDPIRSTMPQIQPSIPSGTRRINTPSQENTTIIEKNVLPPNDTLAFANTYLNSLKPSQEQLSSQAGAGRTVGPSDSDRNTLPPNNLPSNATNAIYNSTMPNTIYNLTMPEDPLSSSPGAGRAVAPTQGNSSSSSNSSSLPNIISGSLVSNLINSTIPQALLSSSPGVGSGLANLTVPQDSASGTGRTVAPSQGNFSSLTNTPSIPIIISTSVVGNLTNTTIPQALSLSAVGVGRTFTPTQGNFSSSSNSSSVPNIIPATVVSNLTNATLPQALISSSSGVGSGLANLTVPQDSASGTGRTVTPLPANFTSPSNTSSLPNFIPASVAGNSTNTTIPQALLSSALGIGRTVTSSAGNLTSVGNSFALSSVIPVNVTSNLSNITSNPSNVTSNPSNLTIPQDQSLSSGGSTRTVEPTQLIANISGNNTSLTSAASKWQTRLISRTSTSDAQHDNVSVTAFAKKFSHYSVTQQIRTSSEGRGGTSYLFLLCFVGFDRERLSNPIQLACNADLTSSSLPAITPTPYAFVQPKLAVTGLCWPGTPAALILHMVGIQKPASSQKSLVKARTGTSVPTEPASGAHYRPSARSPTIAKSFHYPFHPLVKNLVNNFFIPPKRKMRFACATAGVLAIATVSQAAPSPWGDHESTDRIEAVHFVSVGTISRRSTITNEDWNPTLSPQDHLPLKSDDHTSDSSPYGSGSGSDNPDNSNDSQEDSGSAGRVHEYSEKDDSTERLTLPISTQISSPLGIVADQSILPIHPTKNPISTGILLRAIADYRRAMLGENSPVPKAQPKQAPQHIIQALNQFQTRPLRQTIHELNPNRSLEDAIDETAGFRTARQSHNNTSSANSTDETVMPFGNLSSLSNNIPIPTDNGDDSIDGSHPSSPEQSSPATSRATTLAFANISSLSNNLPVNTSNDIDNSHGPESSSRHNSINRSAFTNGTSSDRSTSHSQQSSTYNGTSSGDDSTFNNSAPGSNRADNN
ncbi:hypothetical protein MJO28_011557 [Puccinia striiformis f. sp. tritici]|uniref:Uncharacterized protein n=1 Tax=Puccinia striiformis f. sp. tritici TaxID=168172 RepID=A0ACC0E4G9_9BASI|nr:hypothetical protein MJO28_011557 [Puccinia striiformis f. sp. tritici]